MSSKYDPYERPERPPYAPYARENLENPPPRIVDYGAHWSMRLIFALILILTVAMFIMLIWGVK